MLSMKIRTSIIALVATFSFTAASVLPAVSQATKNTGAYSKSVEALKGNNCHFLLEMFNESLFNLRVHEKSGASDAQIKLDRLAANGMLGEGWREGCAWAREVPPLSPTAGIVAPVAGAGIAAAPEGTPRPLQAVQPIAPVPAR
jgi:hypothetical protein